MSHKVDQKSIEEAYSRICSLIHKTPVLTSSNMNQLTGKQLFFKCENLQKTGSFKARGALNHVKQLLEEGSDIAGLITHSSGNHGQALAWAAKTCGLKCVVVVPENAPACKLEGIHHYGARTVACESTMACRKETCDRLSKELNYAIVDPHNDVSVMCGQGTIAIELLSQTPDLDAVIVSVGGGGLMGGMATYIKAKAPHIKVFCAEPEGKHFQPQLESKAADTESASTLLNTIADGIRVRRIGGKCFPLMAEACESTVFSLTDEEIKEAARLIWERLKVVVEPSAALPLAAVLKYPAELNGCNKIGLILCGGNLNLDHLFG